MKKKILIIINESFCFSDIFYFITNKFWSTAEIIKYERERENEQEREDESS